MKTTKPKNQEGDPRGSILDCPKCGSLRSEPGGYCMDCGAYRTGGRRRKFASDREKDCCQRLESHYGGRLAEGFASHGEGEEGE